MLNLTEIIQKLNKEEKDKFIVYLQNSKRAGESKKIELFKLLDNSKNKSKDIKSKMYAGKKQDAYHQLRKRLFHTLMDFIATQRFEKEEENVLEITKLILSGKYLIENKIYEQGFKLLDNAEQKAILEYDFSSLNEIYNLQVQFSHYNSKIELEKVISKFENNRKHLNQEANLNMAYAMVKNDLEEFRKKGIGVDIKELLEKIYTRFDISEEAGYNFKTLYQMVQIVSANANISKDYHNVLPFVTSQYNRIIKKEEESSRYVFFHLKLLYFIANIYFREKKFTESNTFLDKMKNEMDNSKKKFHKLFLFKIQILEALNYNYSGKNELATKILENAIESSKDKKSKDNLDAKVVSCLFYFQKKEYRKINRIYAGFLKTDNYYTDLMGAEWVMKKNLIEILTHIELGNIDFVDARLDSFIRLNKSYLKQDVKTAAFVKYMRIAYQNPEKVTSESFKNKFISSIEIKPALREDIFVLSFWAWLKAKMSRKEIYETTLELVSGSVQ